MKVVIVVLKCGCERSGSADEVKRWIEDHDNALRYDRISAAARAQAQWN